MIQVGQVLDKYELLERVGQGGMAIVYRGLDRTLKRTVAIKILHRHLSDYQEARDRFEREAQAVAKLRHENILEIFDYSAKEGSESYIVTEFIDGQTLKQFITDRPITFPEIGAMMMLQVCRALAHAHAAGILHRDVKPENIMIRSDGVVKLMDFGISHMVDLERLTVTGQLLGSPAYMAPEHVEGRPLDFRTDVFAVGIVLYQLAVGKLPFEGKNPHEVLKRIAECRFTDPRQANPRIGNRLGRIILRAMAAAPGDRYPAIGEMVIALEAYLDESGLPTDKISSELARYFQAPVAYEQALKQRLIDHLTRRGQTQLDADDRANALDAFDRVLTIDPDNAKVLAMLDGINRRARLKQIALIAAGIVVIAGSGYALHRKMQPVAEVPVVDLDTTGHRVAVHEPVHVEAPPPPLTDAPAAAVDAVAPTIAVTPGDAHRVAIVTPIIDAAVAGAVETKVPVEIRVSPFRGAEYRVDNREWQPVPADKLVIEVGDRPITIDVKNKCCQADSKTIDRASKDVEFNLQLKPARVKPVCAVANVSVSIDGKTQALGLDATIAFERNAIASTKKLKVEFTNGIKTDSHEIEVVAGDPVKEVRCDFH